MAAFIEFADILLEKIQNKASATYESSVFSAREFDTDPAHLSFLLGNLSRSNTQTKAAKQAYGGIRKVVKPQPTPQPPTRRTHSLTSDQVKALTRFQSWGCPLTADFSEVELKKAFRTLAKRLHPDHNQSSGMEFICLRQSYSQLLQVF